MEAALRTREVHRVYGFVPGIDHAAILQRLRLCVGIRNKRQRTGGVRSVRDSVLMLDIRLMPGPTTIRRRIRSQIQVREKQRSAHKDLR